MVEGGEERFPCFGPDSNLYFIADRWPTLGQGDVFVSKPLSGNSDAEMLAKTGITVASSNLPESNYSKWTIPQNLGKEVNTLGDEKHWLSIAPDNSGLFSAPSNCRKTMNLSCTAWLYRALLKLKSAKFCFFHLVPLGKT